MGELEGEDGDIRTLGEGGDRSIQKLQEEGGGEEKTPAQVEKQR